jgi:hypothetical protein
LVRAPGVLGSLTRALTCMDLAFMAGNIVDHWHGDKVGHQVEAWGTAGCAVLLEAGMGHH